MALSFPVSRIALGTAPIASMVANFGRAMTDEDAQTTIQHCLSTGVNFIDTAPFYGNGLAETRVGNSLQALGVKRSAVVIGTKVGWIPDPAKLGGPSGGNGERNYSREAILRSIEASLKRLKIEYIDIAHVHDPERGDYRKVIMDEAYPTLNDLKRQGVIRAVGAGLNETAYLEDYARNVDLDCCLLANCYTLLEQTPLKEAFPLALKNGISIFAGGVFNSGILATGAVPGARYRYQIAVEPIRRLTRIIEGVCKRHRVELKVAAAQFAAAHPAVVALVLGMMSPAEVDENVAALKVAIPVAFWEELKARELIDADAPVP